MAKPTLVTCRATGEKIVKSTAFVTRPGKTNVYFKSQEAYEGYVLREEESKAKNIENAVKDLEIKGKIEHGIRVLIGVPTGGKLPKLFYIWYSRNQKLYSSDAIIESCKLAVQPWSKVDKSRFTNVDMRFAYLSKIIESSLPTVFESMERVKLLESQSTQSLLDTDVINKMATIKQQPSRRGLEEFLNGVC